ncbi:carboxypeptidase-like regulatory domain-containing protein [uncultured Methanobrevibacter sp.]|uniref:carboxypeptidase-like regulatory domain-containing protein n=1 Tax=uncultured Methanobrevibacter sp. TaxID=253161 RepID=UPI0025F51991|nr:carboxypeptidase-like regulatory domain-containing protein [uncultured Methanobrevibacter sp.]
MTDKDSNAIPGATFKYTVNGGDEQTAVTGDDGKYAITGLAGEVTVAVNYEGNESYNPISDSKFFNFTDEPVPSNDTNGSNSTPVPPVKVATKLTASKVTATYNVAKKLVITLKDKNGKALANKKVTVKVGTISKTLTTNKNGQVSLNVATLVPKTYTATVKFAGDSAYSASTVKPKVVVNKAKVKLAAKAKTFKVKAKVKKYTATLKNNKGKVMKNTKLTLKIGKKTYTAKTNKKGVATFKVKLIKKGKNTATLKFAGNKYFKALSKKVKITVKK